MTLSAEALSVLLWGALAAVAVAATYLLVVLVVDWRNRRLW